MISSLGQFCWVNDGTYCSPRSLNILAFQSTPAIPNRICYIYNLVEQQIVYTNQSVAAMLGYSADEIDEMGSLGLATLIHPDDLSRVAEHYQKFYMLRVGDVITITYRMKRANGSWCWLRSQETALVPAASEPFPSQILGMIQDISRLSIPVSKQARLPSQAFKRRVSFQNAPVLSKKFLQ